MKVKEKRKKKKIASKRGKMPQNRIFWLILGKQLADFYSIFCCLPVARPVHYTKIHIAAVKKNKCIILF